MKNSMKTAMKIATRPISIGDAPFILSSLVWIPIDFFAVQALNVYCLGPAVDSDLRSHGRYQQATAAFAELSFQFSWKPYVVPQANFSCQLNVPFTPFRMLFEFFLCQIKQNLNSFSRNLQILLWLLADSSHQL